MTLTKTAAGQQVLKDRSVHLTPQQRTALILIDGKRPLHEVLASAVTGANDVRRLVELGLVAEQAPAAEAAREAPVATAVTPDRYLAAYQAAVRLTSELGLRGVRLNMAVESAGSYEQLIALLPRLRAALPPDKFAEIGALLRP